MGLWGQRAVKAGLVGATDHAILAACHFVVGQKLNARSAAALHQARRSMQILLGVIDRGDQRNAGDKGHAAFRQGFIILYNRPIGHARKASVACFVHQLQIVQHVIAFRNHARKKFRRGIATGLQSAICLAAQGSKAGKEKIGLTEGLATRKGNATARSIENGKIFFQSGTKRLGSGCRSSDGLCRPA